SQRTAIWIGLDPVDRRRPLGPRDADGTETDRPQAENRDGIVFQGTGERGVDRIAKGLLQRGHFGTEPGRIAPAIFGGEEGVAGERSVAIDTKHPHVLAQMIETALTLPARVVDDVRFGGHVGPRFKSSNLGPGGDDAPRHFMPEHPGWVDMAASPVVPIENVDVSPANRRG